MVTSEVEITRQSVWSSETVVLFSVNCPEFLECVLSLINYQQSDPGKGSIKFYSTCLREKQLRIINPKPIQLVHGEKARGHDKGW